MNVMPELFFRQRHKVDTEDLALTFVEEEVGRFDWQKNWEQVKAKGDVRQKIERWLEALNVDHSPDEIIAYLDRATAERAGRWR